MKEIYIGINWEQNSTAALMVDGKILGCISEERFTRIKNDERYPYNAINWLLKNFRISKKDITAICFISEAWTPAYILTRHYTKMNVDDYIYEQKKIWYPRLYKNKKISQLKVFKDRIDTNQYPGKKYWEKNIQILNKKTDHSSNKELIEIGKKIRKEVVGIHLGISENKVKFIDHSTGHVFYSFFALGRIRKTISISLDAFGDFINYKVVKFYLKNKQIQTKEIVKGGNFIIARLYRYITLILGLKPNEHEYKVMGLAPYAKKQYFEETTKLFFSLQDVKGLKFHNKKKIPDLYFYIKELLDGKRFDAISGALQDYTEKLINKWIKNILKKYKFENINLAGGVAMNVKNNLTISEQKKIKNVYIPPSPDDSSQAMGACYVYYFKKFNKQPKPLKNAYLGYQINNELVRNIIKKIDKKKYQIVTKNINEKAALMLADNKVLARCAGRSEFGARALGNRSIIANPSNVNIKKIINEKIKNRDFWMPFAASVLDKYSKKYFKLNGHIENYKYMTSCVKTKSNFVEKLKAGIHPYDNTCRPQIVTKKDNLEYYNLIKKFGENTSIYALLNTSFNLHGYPLVNNEKDAVKVFEMTDLDGLILENYLIIKKFN
ncbi:carbamoyltransferase C-terminal domain-containing protein [Candidatus Pelagibacter sp. HIMB1695]|uniref:carbamoyltransferase C-terminal domain-containing protein n=1 Tax=Candidatus Pelagibacter sp. HIMB1695 TaxID=3413364 RepID=UPI003F852AE3